MVNSPNWEDLPEGLLIEIAEKVGLYDDFESFQAVCRRWRSAWKKSSYGGRSPQVPWLMLPSSTEDSGGSTSMYRSFYRLSKSRIVGSMKLPEAIRDRCCFYSSHGWLLTFSKDLSMSLLNPFSGAKIPLPDKTSLHDDYKNFADKSCFVNFVRKFALSSSPSLTAYYTVIIIYSNNNRLAFWRPGDGAWTRVENDLSLRGCVGLASLNEQFYALNISCQIVACTFDDAWNWRRIGQRREGELIKVHQVADLCKVQRLFPALPEKAYLVESEGKLLAVVQGYANCSKVDINFLVLEVNLSNGEAIVVTDLGDRSLFIGDNHCLSAQASNRYGCKPNCIYFIQNWWPRYGKELCYFSLEDGCVRPHCGRSLGIKSSPLWIEPRC
ncbi:hypothetical protein Ancab_033223 [Ancistrocladus abbreviatus]